MKTIVLLHLFLVLTSGISSAQDIIVLKNGRKADCKIIDFTTDAVKISYRADATAAPAERLIPLAEVDYIEPAPLPGETEARATAIREGRSEPLMIYWVKHLPWLSRPRTNGGEIGLTYAELLTRVNTADRRERALKIYGQIEAADWSAERRGRAQAGRLRVMLRQGRTTEVRPQAEALLQKSGDPRVLIELRHVMAEASAAALTQLEKDHPRWQEEDDLVPQHTQLLNEAFDGYLYPHLFHGAEEDLAARGLWAAAQLSTSQNIGTQAAEWATDLTQLYQTSPEATAAAVWLKQQPAELPKPEAAAAKALESEDTPEEPEAGKSEPKPKTKPKKKPAKTKAKEGGEDA